MPEKTKSIFFCTNSRYESHAANTIQTREMARAFFDWADKVFVTFMGDKEENIHPSESTKLKHYILSTRRNRCASWLYALRAFVLYRRKASKAPFDFVYSRNFLFCVLTSVFDNVPTAIELHSAPRNTIEQLIYRWLAKRKVYFICISQSLAKEMRSNNVREKWLHVAYDAHPFKIPEDIQVGPSDNNRIRIGYFGSLTRQKGSEIIQEIIRSSDDLDFYVYSKEISIIKPAPSLKEYKYISHSKIYQKMQEMDVLLLLVVPQKRNDRISSYTSPLKLYEYLAAGRPIIASDIEVLREDVNEELLVFSKNDPGSIIQAIKLIRNNREKYREMAKRGLKFAAVRTYKTRARLILEFCNIQV